MAASLNCRVLVADDDADLLESVTAALTVAGASVVTAPRGAELLERIAEGGVFDGVITDVSMPWLTGLQVASAMREAGLDVPVTATTGIAAVALTRRAPE